MDEREPHEKVADEAISQADRMQQRVQELGQQIDSTRADWEAKREDESVPGAQPERESGATGSGEPQSPAPDAPGEPDEPAPGGGRK